MNSLTSGHRRYFWVAVVLLLAILVTVQITSVTQESETADESEHLAAGYSYLKTGDFKLNPEHPPLGKILCALPLLLLNPHLPTEHPSWFRDPYEFGKQFLYKNRVPADRLLLYARLVTIILTALLGVALALWTRKMFGASAAIFALVLFAFDPNLIAHGRYVTTDLIAALLIFLACARWANFLVTLRTAGLLLAAVVLGLALASKFSAQILLPIFLLLYLIRCWQSRTGFSRAHLVKSFAVLCVVAFLIIYACYGFETRTLVSVKRSIGGAASVTEKASAEPSSPFISRLGEYPRLTEALDFVASSVPIPAISYLIGTVSVFFRPHTAYLLGKLSATGWWYYFPVVFGIKTPAPTLVLLVLAIAIAVKGKRRRSLRDISFRWFVVVIPPVFYFLASMASKINLGVRHILPIYPFLFVFIAAVLVDHARKLWPVAAALTALLIIGSLRTYPEYLSFFNVFAGGTSKRPQYLLDSNLDWGQDTKRLARYLAQRGSPPACLHGFEDIVLDYYGVKRTFLPSLDSPEKAQKMDCLVIVNVGQLYTNPDFEWLKTQRPDGRIGSTVYVYDFRRKPGAFLQNSSETLKNTALLR